MKIFSLSIVILSSILLNSCASVFSGGSQNVAIKIPMEASLKVDSLYFTKGFEHKVNFRKDLITKQLIFEAEGYKKRYNIILQDDKSKWNILSWVPFSVLLFAPPMFDVAPKSWIFKDSYSFPPLRKYPYGGDQTKNLFVNNVSFDVNKSNFTVVTYLYDNYLEGGDPYYIKNLDSLGIKYSALTDDLDEILKKTNYIDTVNTVFIDNVNSYTLNAKIKNLVFNDVIRTYFNIWNTCTFFDSELTTEWNLQNVYGDTVYSESIKTSSGQYATTQISVETAEKLSIKDALETSMLDFIDKIKEKKLLEIEPNKVEFKDAIKITKPTKTSTNIDESMKATVTIKNKDGHGSGFFVSNDGYIITNHHVVSKNSDYTVVLNDGSEFKAKVLRSNKAIDLALIKIETNNEFSFNIPITQNYKVGDEILAIGTPKSVQLGQSVSKGIVSGTRKNKGMNYLQNDIKINKGNSGGPIVLKDGQLTSVVEFKLIGQGIEGLSFSIPAFDIWQSLNLSY